MQKKVEINATANLKDRTSPGLKKIAGGLRAIGQNRGIKRLASGLRGVSGAVGGLTKRFAALGGAALAVGGVAGALSLGSIVNSYSEATDELAKFSRQTGFTAQSMRELSFVADRQGVSQGVLNSSLVAFSKRFGELKNGFGSLKGVIEKVSPSLAKQVKAAGNVEEAFGLMLGALNKIEDPAKRAALAAGAFSRSGIKLTRIAEAGADGLKALRGEAHKFLGVLSTKNLADAEAFQDSMTNIAASSTGLRDALGSRLIPVLTPLINKLADWIAANRELIANNISDVVIKVANALSNFDWVGFAKSMSDIASKVSGFVEAMGGLENVLIGVGAILTANFFAPFIAGIAQVGWALSSLVVASGPIGWTVAAIAAAATLIVFYWDDVKAAFASVGEFIKGSAQKMAQSLNQFFGDMGAKWGQFKEQLSRINFDSWKQAFSEGLNNARATLAEFVSWFRSTFIDPILNGINRVKSALSGISGAVKAAKGIAGKVGNFFGGGQKTPQVPQVKQRYKGGKIEAGDIVRTGERGDELIFPNVDSYVMAHDKARQLLSGIGLGGARSGQSSLSQGPLSRRSSNSSAEQKSHGSGRTQASLEITVKDSKVSSARYSEKGASLFDRPSFSIGPSMARVGA